MARSLNGTSDVIKLASLVNTAPVAISLSIWVFSLNWAVTAAYNTSWGLTGTVGVKMYVKSNGKLALYSMANYDGTGTNTLATNTWYNWIVVIDAAGNVNSYLNGVTDNGAGFANGGALSLDATNAYFGNDTGTHWFGGSLADAGLWNVALTAGQIAALANGVRPINVNTVNLAGWWPLDGFASPEPDLSGNGNNGTLTGTLRDIGPPQLWRISGSLPGVAFPAAGLNWMINRRDKLGWMPRRKT